MRTIAVGDSNVTFDFVVADVGDMLFLGGFVFDIVCEQEVIDALYLAFREDSGFELIDYSGNLNPVYYWRVCIYAMTGLS